MHTGHYYTGKMDATSNCYLNKSHFLIFGCTIYSCQMASTSLCIDLPFSDLSFSIILFSFSFFFGIYRNANQRQKDVEPEFFSFIWCEKVVWRGVHSIQQQSVFCRMFPHFDMQTTINRL